MIKGLVVGLAVLAGFAACAAVPMGDAKRDQQLKAFLVNPGQSGIYVYRNEKIGAFAKMAVSLDGQQIGTTAAGTYLFKEVPPGRHTVTAKSRNTDSIFVTTEPGRLYYIWQEVKIGILPARTKLHLVGEAEGRKGVLETRLAETR